MKNDMHDKFIKDDFEQHHPAITVLMSVYNGEKYLSEALNSILNQTFEDFELIIVDDASTDKTPDILKDCDDKRIRLFRLDENRGVGGALSYILPKIKGRYVAKADADDIQHPDRLLIQKHYMDSHPDTVLIKSLVEYFTDSKEVQNSSRFKWFSAQKNSAVTSEEISRYLHWFCCIPHCSMMIKADVLKHFGYKPFRICEDYDLFYRLNMAELPMATVEKELVKNRVSAGSITGRIDIEDFVKAVFDIKEQSIVSLLESNKPLYIWGAGSQGRNVNSIIQHRLKIIPAGFVDSNCEIHGKILENAAVYNPEEIAVPGSGNIFIIASQDGKYSIVDYLEQNGYKEFDDFIVFY